MESPYTFGIKQLAATCSQRHVRKKLIDEVLAAATEMRCPGHPQYAEKLGGSQVARVKRCSKSRRYKSSEIWNALLCVREKYDATLSRSIKWFIFQHYGYSTEEARKTVQRYGVLWRMRTCR
jgi:hypothetical protein